MSVETARLLKQSLKSIRLGTDQEKAQTGKDFFKFFFTNYPDLRVYYKGAETFTAEDIQKSDGFDGQRLFLAVHLLAEIYDNQEVFKAYVRETVNRHRQYKMDPAHWMTFFTVFTGFLGTKMALDDATKKAWDELAKTFNDEAQAHLKNSDLPYV